MVEALNMDEVGYENMTVVSILEDKLEDLDFYRSMADNPAAAREFSLAITALEEAIMRTNRGFAKEHGEFRTQDVQLRLRYQGGEV